MQLLRCWVYIFFYYNCELRVKNNYLKNKKPDETVYFKIHKLYLTLEGGLLKVYGEKLFIDEDLPGISFG